MQADDSPGVIEPGRLYTVAEARRRLGLGEASWRELRREGLTVTYRGRRAFVFADDLIAALRKSAEVITT
jgi:hypothetical protein